MYNVKISKINVVRDMKGRKKAIVKLDKKFKADEVAMKLGVI
jgi:ribosomal protein L23